jgi:hypothetical protein
MKKTINAIESIDKKVQKDADNLKKSADHASKEASNIIKDVYKKSQNVKKDVKSGYDELAQDFVDTAENITKEIKK